MIDTPPEIRLTESQKGYLQTLLTRKAGIACRKAGVLLRASGGLKPDDAPYAEFWCRIGKAQEAEHWDGIYVDAVGIFQFSVYPVSPSNNQQTELMAEELADAFNRVGWGFDGLSVETHRTAWKWLPALRHRPAVAIVDGSFVYSLRQDRLGQTALN